MIFMSKCNLEIFVVKTLRCCLSYSYAIQLLFSKISCLSEKHPHMYPARTGSRICLTSCHNWHKISFILHFAKMANVYRATREHFQNWHANTMSFLSPHIHEIQFFAFLKWAAFPMQHLSNHSIGIYFLSPYI